jgi:fructuronate reductase
MTKDTFTHQRTQTGPKPGIVHLGLGAFFRAHGAIYIKEAMACSGGDWGITGVSLRSPRVRDKLATQDGLYTAVEISEQGLKPQVIDVVTKVLVAPEDPAAVLHAMASEATKIVSLTITEKGYCRGSGGAALDISHPDIAHDLTRDFPRSAPGYIVRALDIRRKHGLRPFTVLSLDNLPANGDLTKSVVCELATQIDAELARWIKNECCFPSTMVDRIVPATRPALITRLQSETGIHDPAAVVHEPFRQWVVEDKFVDSARPDLTAAGGLLVDDVEPFEYMKLRMLNGSHSALAYIGSLAGYETVADAVGDPEILAFLDGLWVEEIAPSLKAPPNTDLAGYANSLKKRYQNPEIRHLLEQIAMDGSQKLPQRILDPLFENITAARPHKRLLMVIAAWFRFVQSRTAGTPINDPIAEDLVSAVQRSKDDRQFVSNLLAIEPVFGDYPVDKIIDDLVSVLQELDRSATQGALKGMRA